MAEVVNIDIQHARDTHAKVLSEVVDRIADAEKAFPPCVIPIVAANIAMAAMLDELISEPVGQRLAQMVRVREVCVGPSPDAPAACPTCALSIDGAWEPGWCLCGGGES